MYEQDYIMRINRDVIRTITKLVFNKDTDLTIDITSHSLSSEDKKMLESLYGQVDFRNINQAEKDINRSIYNKEPRAFEKALLFYSYLNEQSTEFLLGNNYSHERIESGLKDIASQLGILDLVNLCYLNERL